LGAAPDRGQRSIAALPLIAQANPNVHSYLPHGIVKHNDKDSLGKVIATPGRFIKLLMPSKPSTFIDYEDRPSKVRSI
jgi:hypothetical protein